VANIFLPKQERRRDQIQHMTRMIQDRGFFEGFDHYAHGIDIDDDASGQQSVS